MRSLRFFLITLLTFLLVTCGAFLKKAIALSLCTILGFESFSCHSFLQSKSRAVAVTLTNSSLVAQDIFGGDRTPQTTHQEDIFQNYEDSSYPSNQEDIFQNNTEQSQNSPAYLQRESSSIINQNDEASSEQNNDQSNFTIIQNFQEIESDLYSMILENPEGCQIVRHIRRTNTKTYYESVEYIVPNTHVCGGKSYIFNFFQNGRRIEGITSLDESFVIEIISESEVNLTFIDSESTEWQLEFRPPSEINSNSQTQSHTYINVANTKSSIPCSYITKNNISNSNDPLGLWCGLCSFTEPLRNAYKSLLGQDTQESGLSQNGQDLRQSSQNLRYSGELVVSSAAATTVRGGVSPQMLAEPLLGKTWREVENSTIGQVSKKLDDSISNDLECGRCSEPEDESSEIPPDAPSPPPSRPQCSQRSNTCIYSAEVYSPLDERSLGRMGGFRASCDASNDQVFRVFENSLSPQQLTALDGTLQIDHCVEPKADRNGLQKSSVSYGDPHMITYDGYRYNFQTIGEYVLSKSVDGTFEVQTRQSQLGDRQFSVNTGAAMKVGSDRVAFYITYFPDNVTDTSLRINGEPTYVDNGDSLSLSNGGTIKHQSGNDYLVEWPNGEYVSIKESSFSGIALLDVTPHVYSNPPGQFTGLLGDLDGDPANDLRSRNGSVIPSRSTYGNVRQMVTSFVPIPGIVPLNRLENAIFDQIYKDFGNSWRVDSAESLFDYRPGEGPATFADPSFPRTYRSLENLTPEQMQDAEAVCIEAGVEPELLDGCVFDVAFTEETGFAEAAANALLDEVGDRVLNEVQRRIPIPIPRLPF